VANDLSVVVEQVSVLCRRFEGLRLKPYLCPAGVPTIGYGTTFYGPGKPVSLTDPAISQKHAEVLLQEQLLSIYIPGVISLCPNLSDYKLAAIVDFSYNLGLGRLKSSTLRKALNSRDWPKAQKELLKWTRGGGKVLPGLVLRRNSEATLLEK
jgi:lysozyme